ncbi:MAG: glycosyltransferase [Chloroflexota bacterium]
MQAGRKDSGGMNVYVLETARELARRGVHVDIYARSHDPSDPQVVELSPGARVIHLEAGPQRPEKDAVFGLLPEFTSRLLDYQRGNDLEYDVVVSHYWLSGLVGLDLSREWRVPHVTSFHTLAEVKRRARPGETEVPERSPSERRVAQQADRVIAWSAHERGLLETLYGADRERVLIIPPGVDTDLFYPRDQEQCRRELGLPEQARILMYVGRVERLKGLEILLQAVAEMEPDDDVCLLIVGGSSEDPERQRLEEVARKLGITGRVVFREAVKQETLPAYYTAADVCLFASYYESFGMAALEASACGTPVIASRVGGLPAVVREGETGYLIPSRCPSAFIQRIEILLANDHLRRVMGQAARHHAEELDWAVAVDRLMGVFCCLSLRYSAREREPEPCGEQRR